MGYTAIYSGERLSSEYIALHARRQELLIPINIVLIFSCMLKIKNKCGNRVTVWGCLRTLGITYLG